MTYEKRRGLSEVLESSFSFGRRRFIIKEKVRSRFSMKHILIVDDDPHIGDMLEEALMREGYGVSRAFSGTEALLWLSSGRAPDLVLLDLMLPGLAGEEVLPRLLGLPVIVMSAKGGVEDKVGLLLGGAK